MIKFKEIIVSDFVAGGIRKKGEMEVKVVSEEWSGVLSLHSKELVGPIEDFLASVLWRDFSSLNRRVREFCHHVS